MALRRFTPTDQDVFAALSGDRNPMHMDEAAARRTQAGRPAVHGVAATLWALEALAADGALARLSRIRADFQNFMAVGADLDLVVTAREEGRLRAEIRDDGARAVALDLRLDGGGAVVAAPVAAEPVPAAPVERDLDDLAGAAGALAAPDGAGAAAAALYPSLSAALGANRVAAIALASAVVGMVAPGLHSIFSGLVIDLGPGDGPPRLGWAVTRTDPRFRLVELEIAGPGVAGSLRTFLRQPPVAPPGFADAARRVPAGAFAGRHALVIGGSRGLGAVAGLLLAAGGAAVTLTWRRGRAEAEALAGEIAAAGGAAAVMPYDAAAPAAPQLDGLPPVSDLLYFATGPITGATGAGFRPERLAAFLAIYATGFADAVAALLARQPGTALRALYPSSAYVEARPAGLTEYAMAKAAGELLAADLARTHRGLTVAAPRLPRVLTDQTATVPPTPAADPLAVMAGVLLG